MFVRDKDSAPAAMHLAELASEMNAAGRTVFDALMAMYRQHGLFVELTRSVYYHGKAGRNIMDGIMNRLRNQPPAHIESRTVIRIIDRKTNTIKTPDGRVAGTVNQHAGNVMQFIFDESGRNRLTARPSGTEPKIKFYAQLWNPVESSATDRDIETLRRGMIEEANRLIDAIAAAEK